MKDVFDMPSPIFQRDYENIVEYYGRHLDPVTEMPVFYCLFQITVECLVEIGILNASTPIQENKILLMDKYPEHQPD